MTGLDTIIEELQAARADISACADRMDRRDELEEFDERPVAWWDRAARDAGVSDKDFR